MSENGKTSETRGRGGFMEFRTSYLQKKRTTCEKVTSFFCHVLLWTALLGGIFSMVRCTLS